VDTYDETSYARMVAAQLGTTHKERIVAESGLSQLQNLVHYLDEPMSDPAILPTWQVSALARESVTVALSGDGADELFGGYERYRFALIANLVKRFTNQGFNKGMSQFMQLATSVTGGKFHTDQFRKFFQFTSRNDDPYFGLIEYFSPEEIQQNFHLELSSSAAWQTITTQNTNQADYLSLILTEDFHHYLADDILVKTDRMSMAVSLEARVPYLDHRLIEFAFSLPIKEKISARGHLKKFLRKSVAPLLPSRILTRPKMGFALPLKEWFADVNNQRIDDLLLAKNSTLSNYMEQCTLKKLLMEHRKEGKNRAFQLYNLFLFETWAQGERKK
jgi:asparagine synthase (glutamine-hydrolysing)